MRELAPHPLRDLDAGEARQIDLDDEHIRLELERLRHGLLAVARRPDELDVRLLLEHLRDAQRRQPARVREQNADAALSLVGQAPFLFPLMRRGPPEAGV